MQLTILVDNNTLIDRYFLAEPGFSCLLQDDDTRLLFDVGYSSIFLENAWKLGCNLAELDYVALSHSHLDHTWGLDPLIRYYAELQIEGRPFKRPKLVAHPQLFISVSAESFPEFGTLLSQEKLAKHFPPQLSAQPQRLSERLVFLGEIPRRNDFEGTLTFGRKDGAAEDDRVIEDSALVYESKEGLVILTGCSHAGICNIIEYAREVCHDTRVVDVVGGFHLQDPPKRQLEETLAYFEALRPQCVHACHCTDLASKIALARVANVQEVGVGLSLEYDT